MHASFEFLVRDNDQKYGAIFTQYWIKGRIKVNLMILLWDYFLEFNITINIILLE